MKAIAIYLEEGKIYKNIDNLFYYKFESGKVLCSKDRINWLESIISLRLLSEYDFEEVKREIDWDKVPRLQPVRVRDYEDEEYKERLFIYKDSGHDYNFACVGGKGHPIVHYNFCEIIGEIKEEWLKEEC